MSKPLDAEVRELLQGKRGEWKAISAACDVSHSWISQFTRGLIPNPGFQTLTKLHGHLSKPAKKKRTEVS